MSGNNGMPGAMPGAMPQIGQIGQMPQGMPGNQPNMPQPANQMGTGMPMGGQAMGGQQAAQLQPPQAIPPALGGGQQPVQMGQNPNQYGLPQTSNYMRQGAMRIPTRQY